MGTIAFRPLKEYAEEIQSRYKERMQRYPQPENLPGDPNKWAALMVSPQSSVEAMIALLEEMKSMKNQNLELNWGTDYFLDVYKRWLGILLPVNVLIGFYKRNQYFIMAEFLDKQKKMVNNLSLPRVVAILEEL
jgi:hypothetical protein